MGIGICFCVFFFGGVQHWSVPKLPHHLCNKLYKVFLFKSIILVFSAVVKQRLDFRSTLELLDMLLQLDRYNIK